MKKKSLLAICIALLSVVFIAGNNPDEKYFEIAKNLEIFANLFKEVNMLYVDDVSPNSLISTGIESMLNSLDPYTNYIPEDQIEDYRVMTTGQYGGIGANIATRPDPATGVHRSIVIMPLEGFPAHQAGLLIGDQVLKIDGINIEGKDNAEVSQLMKGQAGTPVTLTIKRFGADKPIDFKIMREKITIHNVPYYGMVNNEVGLIQLTDFTHNAGKEVKDALQKLKEQGAKKIILDLRGNPGGLLNEAVNISNIFVDKGNEIVSTKGKVKEWNKVYTALNPAVDTEIPLVVLTNGNSASAAEIVSGVVQDYDRGVLIGQNTFGKGLVQATRSLSYNSKLKVTVAKYYIPSGRCIQAIDYSHRNADGSAGKIADSLRATFKTVNGRLVYDGGGVKPDVELPRRKYAPITQALISRGHLFDYATEFRHRNASIPDARSFKMNDQEYNAFVKWMQNKEYDYASKVQRTLEELEKVAVEERNYDEIKGQLTALKERYKQNKEQDLVRFKSEIKEILEKEIASRYYLERGAIESTFDDDPEILAALDLFKNESRYWQLLGKRK